MEIKGGPIGISKDTCFACGFVFRQLPSFEVRQSHEREYKQCYVPDFLPDEILARLAETLIDRYKVLSNKQKYQATLSVFSPPPQAQANIMSFIEPEKIACQIKK